MCIFLFYFDIFHTVAKTKQLGLKDQTCACYNIIIGFCYHKFYHLNSDHRIKTGLKRKTVNLTSYNFMFH